MIGNTNSNVNPNQLANVNENGDLIKNGTVYTGFSKDDFLTMADLCNNRIWSGYRRMSFKNFFSTANTWEFNGSFTLFDKDPRYQDIFGSYMEKSTGIILHMNNDNLTGGGRNDKLELWIAGIDGDPKIRAEFGAIDINTKYYFKIQYTADSIFKLYINTDGITWTDEGENKTLVGTYDSQGVKPVDTTRMVIGHSTYGYFIDGSIDIRDWSVYKDGQLFWKSILNF